MEERNPRQQSYGVLLQLTRRTSTFSFLLPPAPRPVFAHGGAVSKNHATSLALLTAIFHASPFALATPCHRTPHLDLFSTRFKPAPSCLTLIFKHFVPADRLAHTHLQSSISYLFTPSNVTVPTWVPLIHTRTSRLCGFSLSPLSLQITAPPSGGH